MAYGPDTKLHVNFPPDPNPRTPGFAVPEGTCDTHFHVFGPPHLFPYVEKRLYTPPAAPIVHYLAMADAVGIRRAVLVQPNVHGFDTAVTLDAIARGEGRIRGMIRADASLEPGDYKRLHAGGVRAVRFNFVSRLGGGFDRERFERILSMIEPFHWTVDLHVDPEVIPERADIIRRIPLPVAIDHFAGVDAREGVRGANFRALIDLLGESHVWIKIAGADRLMERGAALNDIVPLAHALIERTPDRVVWGTDWPHSGRFEPGHTPNDGDLMNMMADFAPDEAVRRRILADNPARLFDFN